MSLVIIATRDGLIDIAPGDEVHLWDRVRSHVRRAFLRKVYRLRCQLERVSCNDPLWTCYRLVPQPARETHA